jgi:hypothetical protein
MRIAFILLLILHAVVHVFWFTHAFGWTELEYFQKDIPPMVGFSWLMAAFFLAGSAIQLGKQKLNWFHPALIGVLISQMWIFSAWEDTKMGSLVNLVLLAGILIGFFKGAFEGRFKEDVQAVFENLRLSGKVLKEKHLKPLPDLVQHYIRRSGAVGKPKVENFYLEFEGEMRRQGEAWFGFNSRQYTFLPRPARFFFMKARVKGVSTQGYHSYQPPLAKMVVKVLSIYPVAKADQPEMLPTETVTFLNDLCLFAPGALIDDRIRWETLDESRVRAIFTYKQIEVSAVLFFNAEGDLADFRSEDRFDIGQMKRLPFTTPVKEYREFEGIRVPSYGEAIWHYPDGPFVYGKLRLKAIRYNLAEMPEGNF